MTFLVAIGKVSAWCPLAGVRGVRVFIQLDLVDRVPYWYHNQIADTRTPKHIL